MGEWKEFFIEDFGVLLNQKRIPLSSMERNKRKGLYPYYGASGIIDYVDNFIFEGEHVLISEDGENLKSRHTPIAFLASGKFWVNNHAHIFKGTKPFYNKLLIYYFANIDLNPFITGAVQPKLNKATLSTIPILLPSNEDESKAIVSTLSSLDDKIDLLHRQNATLEKMAETLFIEWFVVPIKKITNEGTQVKGFSNAKFDKWILETVGGEWGKENIEGDFDNTVYCIRGTDIADLNKGIPERTPIRFVKETKFKNIEPLEGDLIIEISGGTENQSTGRVCYINQDVKKLFKYPLVFSNFCRMIRVKKPEYSFFLYCYIQYLYNQDEFFNLENGSSGIKNLDYKALLFELKYPMPNDNLVVDFHAQVKPIFKKVNHNKSQIQTLNALRDNLLPKLLSGEVTVG